MWNAPVSASEMPSLGALELNNTLRGIKKKPVQDTGFLIKKIKEYIENEQHTEAMLELNRLLEANLDDPEIYIMSADLLRKTHQFDEAEKMAKKALELDYKNSGAYLALGYIFFDRAQAASNPNKFTEGIEDYLTKSFDYFFIASQYDPANPFPHIALADAYYANMQKQRAKDEILKAKELSFNMPEAFYEIGQYYYKIKDYDMAKKYIEKSIDAGRDHNYQAYYIVGRISEQKGDFEEAQKKYLQALRLKPDMPAAQEHLDILIKTAYKEKKAEEGTPKDLFADVDEKLGILMKADYYLMIDEFTKARDLYITLLEKNPRNVNAAAGIAELYYSKWKEGFSSSNNFTQAALYVIKSKPCEKNRIALLKFQMINEDRIPEKIRQSLINLSISETFEFYDLLNEIRAEYLLGNYEECHNKLFKLLNMKLSNYEKFKVLKSLCYDHNYYEALIVLEDLKKTYYHNEEIDPVERRIKTKLSVADEKLSEALGFLEEKKYHKSLSIYKDIMNYFPAYKPVYLHYALTLDEMGYYDEAYEKLNTYYKLYRLYPEADPEIEEEEIKELIRDLYKKIREQIKQKSSS